METLFILADSFDIRKFALVNSVKLYNSKVTSLIVEPAEDFLVSVGGPTDSVIRANHLPFLEKAAEWPAGHAKHSFVKPGTSSLLQKNVLPKKLASSMLLAHLL